MDIYSIWAKSKNNSLSKAKEIINEISKKEESTPFNPHVTLVTNIYSQEKAEKILEKINKSKIKISGCINACGHHHVGNIGILGLDKNGEESYQISLGGSADEKTKIGQIVGPSFTEKKLMSAIETIIKTYEDNRLNLEDDFISVFNRVGIDKFKQDLYEKNNS